MNKIADWIHDKKQPKKSKYLVEKTDAYILKSPWPQDISISRSSFIGSGAYDSVPGQHYHSVSCAADGPNPGGNTYHHGYIGYWRDFESFEAANIFAGRLQRRIEDLIGVLPPLYASGKDENDHAAWVLGDRKKRPAGITLEELPTSFYGYEA